jgi:(p)ppGpp synthase/HD superfamily hydrolase
MVLTLEINDLEQLSRILDKIGQIPNVMEVRRKGTPGKQ